MPRRFQFSLGALSAVDRVTSVIGLFGLGALMGSISAGALDVERRAFLYIGCLATVFLTALIRAVLSVVYRDR